MFRFAATKLTARKLSTGFTQQLRLPLQLQTPLKAIQVRQWHPPPAGYDPQFGDYPKLPWIPHDKRSPYAHYDDPVHRRNFGETVPEEFDLQDAYFPGDHTPWENFKEGLKGQIPMIGIVLFFLGAAYLFYLDDNKAPPNVLPEEVVNYLKNSGWDEVRVRPYEVPKLPPLSEQVAADSKFAKIGVNEHHHH
ncbi:hypothetical protein MP638_003963 [Amoeboaphelidium occidentale]|nr:hypothetical protein MP638_003963 [Amoeboaphelidium occidentale]